MNNNQPDWITRYIDYMENYHEIYFDYEGFHYAIEPADKGYEIWKHDLKDKVASEKIATFDTPEKLFNLKCFESKDITEIHSDIENCHVH